MRKTHPGSCHGGADTRTPQGEVYVPLRILPKGRRRDLELTLFRQPQMTDERFAADSEWVMRDLLAAKRLLENRS